MIDHIVISVGDLERSKAFYREALVPVGYEPIMEFPGVAAFGQGGKPSFWIRQGEAVAPAHVAFASPDRPTVDAFHAAALAAGGRDNGGPGIRAIYHANYYGAFVLDPDGHNVEAVCHRPG
jgi:catechol 2,3-dioxygenase-like lactoylglutathione lyase family enzyme